MSKVQLAVGQVWKDRKGWEVRIEQAGDVPYKESHPFKNVENNHTYRADGMFGFGSVETKHDLIELVQDENGWRPWKATADSQCPVDGDTLVHLRFGNGDATSLKHPSPAGDFAWRDVGPESIVAYRIVEEAPKAAAQPDADGWIPYAGGGCPVDGDVTVEVRLRSGQENVAEDAEAADYWDWGIDDVGGDIVAYKIVEDIPKAVEPVHAEAHCAQHREAQEAPAIHLLQVAADHMRARAATYDKPDGERSMGKTIAAFNAVTDRDLSEAEGWLLLQLLKDVRLFQRPGYHADSAEDCIAYSALKAEAKMAEGA